MAFPPKGSAAPSGGGLKNPASGHAEYVNPGSGGEPTGAGAHGSQIVSGRLKPPAVKAPGEAEPASSMSQLPTISQPSHPTLKGGNAALDTETLQERVKSPYGPKR